MKMLRSESSTMIVINLSMNVIYGIFNNTIDQLFFAGLIQI